jgi:hypothetical protein
VITERLTFQAKYGHGDELVALFKESMATFQSMGATGGRLYTDLTGTMFTVITELDYPSMDEWARIWGASNAEYGSSEFQEWFARMMAVTERGDRQLLNMEQLPAG